MTTTKTRVANAFRAMKSIGISEDKVKPVLKNLLKVYEKNWELIEEENYRALADAIFESEDAQANERVKMIESNEANERAKKIESSEAAERSRKTLSTEKEDDADEEAQATEELQRPLKRLRLRYREGQTSSNKSNSDTTRAPLIRPKEEPVELPENQALKSKKGKGLVEPALEITENARVTSETDIGQSMSKDKGKQPVTPHALTIYERGSSCQPNENAPLGTDSRSAPHPMRLRDRGKGSVSPLNLPKEKRPVSESSPTPSKKKRSVPESSSISPQERRSVPKSSSHAKQLKEPKIEPGTVPPPKKKSNRSTALLKPKDEPITDDMPDMEVPIAVIHPDQSNEGEASARDGETRRDYRPGPSERHSIIEPETTAITASPNEPRSNEKLDMITSDCSSNLEIASSPSGEVKISLHCDFPLGRPYFQMPNLEAVLKLVEDKCLGAYKTMDPNVSVMNLMKETCQCFLKLGTESNNESPDSVDVTPGIDLVNKSSAAGNIAIPSIDLVNKSSASGTVGSEGPSSASLNAPVDPHSDAEVPRPITPLRPLPCNGLDDSQPGKKDGVDETGKDPRNQENHAEETNTLSLVVVQKPQVTPDVIRSLHDVVDIAKGQESVVITLVNEVNDECPPSFHYIPQNALFQNAYVNFSLARIGDNNCCSTCSSDCLSLSTPCACAHETGGEFAYTADGLVKEELLKECISMNRDPKKHCQFFCKECPLERSKSEDITEPCKGHLVRKFIKECWWKCGCSKQCGNRVVQRGINYNLQVFMTPGGKGWGLRTLEELPKGAFVCEYVGEVLTNAELFDRVLRSPEGEKHSYPVLLDADWCAEGVLKDEEALCLDATYYGNVARFINHRCYDSNLVEIPVEIETPDHHYYHLAFFTTRKVKAMEELTWDYGIDFDDNDHPIKAFRCQCGSKFCRNIKRSRSRARRW